MICGTCIKDLKTAALVRKRAIDANQTYFEMKRNTTAASKTRSKARCNAVKQQLKSAQKISDKKKFKLKEFYISLTRIDDKEAEKVSSDPTTRAKSQVLRKRTQTKSKKIESKTSSAYIKLHNLRSLAKDCSMNPTVKVKLIKVNE
jgi:hypothetical protein